MPKKSVTSTKATRKPKQPARLTKPRPTAAEVRKARENREAAELYLFEQLIPSEHSDYAIDFSWEFEGTGAPRSPEIYKALRVYHGGKERTPEHCKAVVLSLYPGITLAEAQRAAKLAVKKLPRSSQAKGGRTPHDSDVRLKLQVYFNRYEFEDERLITRLEEAAQKKDPNWRKSTQPRRKGKVDYQTIASAVGISQVSVKKEYRLWQIAQGKTPKGYTTTKQDTRG